ncbi:MAG: response regulator [Candidatus Schekmanbacteria bacterium]|nr:MAG: response regulator [Candidatus Schekmanbacteria bacterium]
MDEEDKAGYILSQNLSKRGYSIEYFDNGEKAKNKLKSSIYDILITGLKGKKYSGLKLLKYIREKNLNTDVIIYTAYGDVESYIKASRLGAIEYINKPVTADFFESLIKKLSGTEHLHQITRIETSDRRRHNRYPIKAPAHIIKREKEKIKKIEATIQNISLSGVLLSACYEFSENQEIELNLMLSGMSIYAESIIRRIIQIENNNEEMKRRYAGLEFKKIPEKDYHNFKKYLESI